MNDSYEYEDPLDDGDPFSDELDYHDYSYRGKYRKSSRRSHPGPKSRVGLVDFRIGNRTYSERRSCQHCGTPVRWAQKGGRWLLFETQTGDIHTKNCPKYQR